MVKLPRIRDVVQLPTMGEVAKVAIGGLVLYSLLSHNGLLDSPRTKMASRLHNMDNSTKTVSYVDEKWSDNIPMMHGYNPRVIRNVNFDDGSQTTLSYRTMAWQPFMRWLGGEEFDPQVGERYEVSHGQLVKKVN